MLTEAARRRLETGVYQLDGTDGVVISEATREQLLEIVGELLQEKAYIRRRAEYEREMLAL